MIVIYRPFIAVLVAIVCTSCGLKGPLYLPDTATNIEVRPPATPGAGTTPAGDEPSAATDTEHGEERRKSDTTSPATMPQD